MQVSGDFRVDIDQYSSKKNRLNLDEFLSLPKEQAIMYDFLRQGDEPDSSSLIKKIYELIFPWYDKKEHSGDTLNTYRLAIRKYYGKPYRSLNRQTQLQIIDIISKYTLHDENYLFEFEDIDKHGNIYHQISNNYQLGNFGILPRQYGINPRRSQKPYTDFLDKFVIVVFDFYNNQDFAAVDSLKKAIQLQKNYFDYFGSFRNFAEDNFMLGNLVSFRVDNSSGKYGIIKLSECVDFENYVATASNIIAHRGAVIWEVLHSN